jgi:hypothetical protein
MHVHTYVFIIRIYHVLIFNTYVQSIIIIIIIIKQVSLRCAVSTLL